MMKSTTIKLNHFKYAATLIGAVAVAAFAPATANALPNNNNGADAGCHYTDKDGYDIPIDDGQSVFVDGKLVTCHGGTITVTTAPASSTGVGGVKPAPGVPPRLGNVNLQTINARQ